MPTTRVFHLALSRERLLEYVALDGYSALDLVRVVVDTDDLELELGGRAAARKWVLSQHREYFLTANCDNASPDGFCLGHDVDVPESPPAVRPVRRTHDRYQAGLPPKPPPLKREERDSLPSLLAACIETFCSALPGPEPQLVFPAANFFACPTCPDVFSPTTSYDVCRRIEDDGSELVGRGPLYETVFSATVLDKGSRDEDYVEAEHRATLLRMLFDALPQLQALAVNGSTVERELTLGGLLVHELSARAQELELQRNSALVDAELARLHYDGLANLDGCPVGASPERFGIVERLEVEIGEDEP